MATLSLFNRKVSKVKGFVTAYKLYLRMRMRGMIVEKQVQWMLTYMQEELANMQKENVLEDLEAEILEFEIVEKVLEEIKKEFGEEDKESKKVAELKELEQD